MKAKVFLVTVAALLGIATAANAARLDVITGTSGPDQLSGTGGNDLIYARSGNDIVRAHGGNDVIYAGPGNDVTWPGAGADVQYGGEGNDVLHALANDNQPDVLDCGPGFDVAYVIVHDPARFRGCESVIRLSPEAAEALAQANSDS
jgi:Ca2+-binding RTX toxin-like protein